MIVAIVLFLVGACVAGYLHYWRQIDLYESRLKAFWPPLNARNAILLFDIHGVILKPDYWGMVKAAWRMPRKVHLFWRLIQPGMVMRIIPMLFRHRVIERCFIELADYDAALQPYVPLLITMTEEQTLMPGMDKLLHTLKQAGYPLHILSNIGERTFAGLYGRFPALFDLFEVIEVAKAVDNYHGKPHMDVFERYLRVHNPGGKHVVFVDDKLENIRAAYACGMVPIRYRQAHALMRLFRKHEIL